MDALSGQAGHQADNMGKVTPTGSPARHDGGSDQDANLCGTAAVAAPICSRRAALRTGSS